MVSWNHKLYMDETIAKNPKKYKRFIERAGKKKKLSICYLITLPVNQENSMEIYSSWEFWFRYRREQGLEVIGLAKSRDSAMDLVTQIVSDVYRMNGSVSAKEIFQYFKEKEKDDSF